MKIIKDNTQLKIKICHNCGFTLECSLADYSAQNEYAYSIGVEYFDCPCCGHRNYKRCAPDDVKTNK